MTPEDERRLQTIRAQVRDGNPIVAMSAGKLLRIIDDLRRELANPNNATAADVRAVDGVADHWREQSLAWEVRARYFDRELRRAVGFLNFCVADSADLEREAYSWAVAHLEVLLERAAHKHPAPEPKGA